MRLQEALFLSSQRKATYECGLPPDNNKHAFRCYLVQVEIKWQDRLKQGPVEVSDAYEISVSRKEGETIYPPHTTHVSKSLGGCMRYLKEWGVGEEFEHPWVPVEEWEPKPITKQTDLAEEILGWAKRNKEEIQNMAVHNIAGLLQVFLIDVENLCLEYVGDEHPSETCS